MCKRRVQLGGGVPVPTWSSTRLFGNAFSLVPHMQMCIQAVELRSSGREPYAYRFARTHMAAELQRRFQDLPAGEVADLQVLAARAGYRCTLHLYILAFSPGPFAQCSSRYYVQVCFARIGTKPSALRVV